MVTAYAREAMRIHEVGHLSNRDIARATGAADSTVRSWLNKKRSPTGTRADRLTELSAIVDRLVRVLQPTYIQVWMNTPLVTLNDDSSLEAIAKGNYREVSKIVSALESPPASIISALKSPPTV